MYDGSIVAGFADGDVPFVVTRYEIVQFHCRIPVIPGGDGALEVPLQDRTARCGRMTHLMVGRAPTCAKHLADALTLLGDNRLPNLQVKAWMARECAA